MYGKFVYAIIGPIDVGIAWWVLGRLPIKRWVRLVSTLFLAFGTVLWYAAQLGTTWFQAHVLAVGLALLAIGLVIGADPDAIIDEDDLPEDVASPASGPPEARRAPRQADGAVRLVRGISGRQFLAGFLFGLACAARLTMIFAVPFFVLVGGGGAWVR